MPGYIVVDTGGFANRLHFENNDGAINYGHRMPRVGTIYDPSGHIVYRRHLPQNTIERLRNKEKEDKKYIEDLIF